MGPSGLLEGANKKQNEVEKSQNKDDARIENLEDELAKLEPIDYSINPVITVSDDSGSEGTATKTKNITISVMDKGSSGLSSSNSYQYFLSSSGTSLTGGSWTTYTNGKSFTVGSGKNGAYYLFVKRVKNNDGGESQENGTAITVSGTTYQRFGPYNFDNTGPTIAVNPTKTSTKVESVKITITASDAGGGLSSLNSYQYVLSPSSSSITNGKVFNYNSGVTQTISAENAGNYYIYVKQISDTAGNKSTSNGNNTALSGYHRFGPYMLNDTNVEIVSTGIRYADLKSAIDNTTKENEELKVIKDYTDSSMANVNKNLKINTNGHTVTKTSYAITIERGITAELTGTGKITTSSSSTNNIINNNGGILNITGSVTTDNINTSTISISNNGKVTINGGTVTGNGSNTIALGSGQSQGGELTLISGSIKNIATDSEKNSANDSTKVAIYAGNNSKVNISGGTVTGLTGIDLVGTSTINASGGTITGESRTAVVINSSSGSNTISNTTINGTTYGVYNVNSNLAITGGNITAYNGVVMASQGDLTLTNANIEGTGENGVGFVGSGNSNITNTTIRGRVHGIWKSGSAGTMNIGGNNTLITAQKLAGTAAIGICGRVNITGGRIGIDPNNSSKYAPETGIYISSNGTAFMKGNAVVTCDYGAAVAVDSGTNNTRGTLVLTGSTQVIKYNNPSDNTRDCIYCCGDLYVYADSNGNAPVVEGYNNDTIAMRSQAGCSIPRCNITAGTFKASGESSSAPDAFNSWGTNGGQFDIKGGFWLKSQATSGYTSSITIDGNNNQVTLQNIYANGPVLFGVSNCTGNNVWVYNTSGVNLVSDYENKNIVNKDTKRSLFGDPNDAVWGW